MERAAGIKERQLRRILDDANIQEPVASCVELLGGYSHQVYELNGTYILRIACERYSGRTHARLARERAVLQQLRGVAGVPTVLGYGTVQLTTPPSDAAPSQRQGPASARPYLLLTKLPGQNAFRAWLDLSESVRHLIIRELVALMRGIHATHTPHYTIGFHQTALPGYRGSWIDGHDAYVQRLLALVHAHSLDAQTAELVRAAGAYYAEHREALDYSVGPRLIHGDLHLYNVIVDAGRVTGLVDWEWAGGGEPDFDLAHLIRWAWFPAHPAEEELEAQVSTEQYLPLIPDLFAAYHEIASLPRLWERLTIYEIEYDLHQLTQSPHSTQARERLKAWLDARVLEPYQRG